MSATISLSVSLRCTFSILIISVQQLLLFGKLSSNIKIAWPVIRLQILIQTRLKHFLLNNHLETP
ncbi:hypothetical protein KKK_05170 [Pseudomonas putida B6-2]|nr:hypothetical protein KKK_05170 [Pseudomonas putida B6-2]